MKNIKAAAAETRPAKNFLVYFEQVNQTRISVSARSREEAEDKARRAWARDYGFAVLKFVEEFE